MIYLNFNELYRIHFVPNPILSRKLEYASYFVYFKIQIFCSEKWWLLSHIEVYDKKLLLQHYICVICFSAFWSWMSRPKLLQESNSTLVDPQILILAKLLAAWKQNTNVPTMAWLLPKNGLLITLWLLPLNWLISHLKALNWSLTLPSHHKPVILFTLYNFCLLIIYWKMVYWILLWLSNTIELADFHHEPVLFFKPLTPLHRIHKMYRVMECREVIKWD